MAVQCCTSLSRCLCFEVVQGNWAMVLMSVGVSLAGTPLGAGTDRAVTSTFLCFNNLRLTKWCFQF